jgi:EmrB/QacA subfamily drug resistance transporter
MQKTALIIISLSSFLTPFTLSSVNVALPTIGREFAVDAITLNWIATAYLLSSAMFLVPFGRLADIKGRKRVFTVGIALFTLGSTLAGLSNSAEMIIMFRVLQGLGGGMVFATGVAILTSIFPLYERGKILGINVASVYTGLSLGPFLGGILTQHFGWRSVFLIILPLGIIIVLLSLIKLKTEWADAKGERFDFIGSVLYSMMLVSTMIGVSESSLLLISVGIGLLIIFVVHEGRISYPIMDIGLFRRNPTFALSNMSALLNYSATFAITFLLSLYLQYIKDLSPQHAGMILVAQPIVMAMFSPLAGWISDRVEPRVVASVGMSIIAIGLFIFSWIEESTSVEVIVGNLVFIGVGFALFSSPNVNAIMSSVEKRFYGIASATLATMRVVGQMLSMAIVIVIFALYIGKIAITPEVYESLIHSTKVSFVIFSILCLIGIFTSLARGRIRE